jgi:fatty acid desaturase
MMPGSDAAAAPGRVWTAETIRRALPPEALAQLGRPAPMAAITAIGTNLAAIVALIAMAEALDSPWAMALAVVFIAGRQHAMLVMMHDAAHRLISPRPWLNDLISNLFLSFPLLVSTALYRQHHLRHHRYVNTEADPDLNDAEIPPNLVLFLLQLLGDLLGLRSLRMLASVSDFGVFGLFKPPGSQMRGAGAERVLFLAFVGGALALTALSGAWMGVLIYWVVPMWFILPPLLHLRVLAEHAGRSDQPFARHARSIDASLLERALICPMQINRHLEHHILPDIPCHRLPEVTRLLAGVPGLDRELRRNRGYLLGPGSVLAEIYAAERGGR